MYVRHIRKKKPARSGYSLVIKKRLRGHGFLILRAKVELGILFRRNLKGDSNDWDLVRMNTYDIIINDVPPRSSFDATTYLYKS